MCNAVPVEAQTEVRNQLASSLAWINVQQLEYLEKAGQRVPVLTIVHGTQAIKNIIRDNKLNQINNAIDASKNTGMFLPERYLTHYLNTRSDFNPYGKIFRPSAELSPNDFYQSPLTGEQEIKDAAKQEMTRPASQTIIDMSEYSDENVDNMLDINDNISLRNIVDKLNKNSE